MTEEVDEASPQRLLPAAPVLRRLSTPTLVNSFGNGLFAEARAPVSRRAEQQRMGRPTMAGTLA